MSGKRVKFDPTRHAVALQRKNAVMPASHQVAIRLGPLDAAAAPSRARKQFNVLVRLLETERARLADWWAQLPGIRALADSTLLPLIQACDARDRDLLLLYDRCWSDKALSKRDREKLSDLICSTALDIMQHGDDDALVKTLYDKHSIVAFPLDVLSEDRAVLTAMLRDRLGIELDAATDFSSPHTIIDAIRVKMEEVARAHDAATSAHCARPGARALRRLAEEDKMKQSVRDIFRKLVSALHPDREPDPAERSRKTALMQRVNVAYAANDLLGLLTLQLEIEQVDQASLDQLGDERIRQYNRILTRQVDAIRDDIIGLSNAFAFDMGLPFNMGYTPRTLEQALQLEIAQMRNDLARIEYDLARFADIHVLKAWLKTYRIGDNGPDAGAPWC